VRNPNVPESLDGWAILHRMFRFDRRRWDALAADRRDAIEAEARALFETLARDADTDLGLAQLLGHKGELMLTHYARSLDVLGEAQARVDKLALRDLLEPMESYVSILELGLYEYTAKSTPSCAIGGSSRTPSPGTNRSMRCSTKLRASRATRGGCGHGFRAGATPASTR